MSGFRSWAAFRGLIGEAEYFDAAVSDTDKIQELLEFVAWCASPHQLTNRIAHVVAAYQACIERGDAIARCRRNPKKSASPDFVGFIVGRTRVGFILGSGWPRSWLSLALGYFFVARSDEIFASPAGAVHPVHCLTRRDVALYKGCLLYTSDAADE